MLREHYTTVPIWLDQIIPYEGREYVGLHEVPLAAGPFLLPSFHSIEICAELPPEKEFRHGIRYRQVNGLLVPVTKIFAARVRGDSMINKAVYHGDIAFFLHSEFEHVDHGKILVIEKLGDEEGFGAWSLKRLIIEKPKSFRRNEFDEEIDWEEPEVLVLRSHNPQVNPWRLDGRGRYRVRGIFLGSRRSREIRLVDAETILRHAAGE